MARIFIIAAIVFLASCGYRNSDGDISVDENWVEVAVVQKDVSYDVVGYGGRQRLEYSVRYAYVVGNVKYNGDVIDAQCGKTIRASGARADFISYVLHNTKTAWYNKKNPSESVLLQIPVKKQIDDIINQPTSSPEPSRRGRDSMIDVYAYDEVLFGILHR